MVEFIRLKHLTINNYHYENKKYFTALFDLNHSN